MRINQLCDSSFCHYIEALVAMGYNRQEIAESLAQVRYDDVFATYLLLGRKSTDVRESSAMIMAFFNNNCAVFFSPRHCLLVFYTLA